MREMVAAGSGWELRLFAPGPGLPPEIVKTLNITQSAVGKKGKWTTVIALAVFIPPENDPSRSRK